MSPFKKIVVCKYNSDGDLQYKMILTTKSSVLANDYVQAKKLVAQVIQVQVLEMKYFSVEWVRDGNPEGYMVHRK